MFELGAGRIQTLVFDILTRRNRQPSGVFKLVHTVVHRQIYEKNRFGGVFVLSSSERRRRRKSREKEIEAGPVGAHLPVGLNREWKAGWAGISTRCLTMVKQEDPDFEPFGMEEGDEEEEEEEDALDDLEEEVEEEEEVDDDLEEDDVLVAETSAQKKKTKKGTGVQRNTGKVFGVDIGNGAGGRTMGLSEEERVVPDLEDCLFDGQEVGKLRSSLLDWYDKNHRVLPWRRNPHSKLQQSSTQYQPAPLDLAQNDFIYYVWVCEIMSQQTQVSRVCEYFTKWVKKWPTVHDLAKATQDEVNDMWAGLGYYRRARYLLEGAKYVVNDLNGDFPKSAQELQKIPGIGAYTSRAIASTACGEKVAVVDGNVVRVFARLRKIGGDPKSTAMTKLMADLAEKTLDDERPGDFNQSIMELGATVCIPNGKPSCNICPVSSWCLARKAEKENPAKYSVTQYPFKSEKAQKREERVGVTVVRILSSNDTSSKSSDGQFLLVKRPPGGLLAGLWEFPLKHVDIDASQSKIQDTMDKYLASDIGLDYGTQSDYSCNLKILKRRQIGETVHIFSHIRMTMVVEELCLQGKVPDSLTASTDFQWLTNTELTSKGLSSGVKKVLKLFQEDNKKRKMNTITTFFSKKK